MASVGPTLNAWSSNCWCVVLSDALLALGMLFVNGATTSKLAPLEPIGRTVPVPLQQEQLATAAREAVQKAVGLFDGQDLAGRLARVQVAGAYAPSDHDMLDFIGGVAEAKLAAKGVRIEPKAVPHSVLVQTGPPLVQPGLAGLARPDELNEVLQDQSGSVFHIKWSFQIRPRLFAAAFE
jgi:hypothetical protein